MGRYVVKQVNCASCEKPISPQAKACPACGHPNKLSKNLSATQAIGALLLAGFGLWWYFGGGWIKATQPTMNQVMAKVATDAIDQYNIAKRGGDAVQTCVQAQSVVAAYLQAKDEADYTTWKATAHDDCKKAGIDL